MSQSLNDLKNRIIQFPIEDQKLLRKYLEEQAPYDLEKLWGIGASVILDAIQKASDLSKRGLRGILAEAIFESDVIPTLGDGWSAAELDRDKDLPFDSLLVNGDERVRIQVKLQRSEKGVPKLFHPKHYEKGSLYVVEVQKTRTGKSKIKMPLPDSDEKLDVLESVTEDTRPYRFGQFDIIAVNMHPSSNDWRAFRYTVADWLLPRDPDTNKIAVLQPVSKLPNDVWTDDLATCLGWLRSGEKRKVLDDLKYLSPKTIPSTEKAKTRTRA